MNISEKKLKLLKLTAQLELMDKLGENGLFQVGLVSKAVFIRMDIANKIRALKKQIAE